MGSKESRVTALLQPITQRHCLNDGAFYFYIDGYADKTASTLELPTLGADRATDAIKPLLKLGAAEYRRHRLVNRIKPKHLMVADTVNLEAINHRLLASDCNRDVTLAQRADKVVTTPRTIR